ncbi:MAG: hypothetical protein IJ141_05120 [Lachnospiraceae bacterium]|nr:hypothetical protein [Lachnospiraceae bacterium]
MRLKKFMTGAVCVAMLISGSGIGNLTSYAEEVTEVSVEWESVEPEENTEDVTEAESIDSDGDLEETLITVGSLESEAQKLDFGKEYSGHHEEYDDRSIYKFTLTSDEILTFKGTLYSASAVINLYDENGKEIKGYGFDMDSNVGFRNFEETLCVEKGYYYVEIKHRYYSSKALDFKISIDAEYSKSTETEPNNDCINANLINPNEAQYGMINSRTDDYDTFKFESPYDGKVTVNVKGRYLGSLHSFQIGVRNADGELIDVKDIYYDEGVGEFSGKIEVNIKKGFNYIQLARHYNQQFTYCFEIILPSKHDSEGTLFSTYKGYSFYIDKNENVRCFDSKDNPVINDFKCDGTYTYYFQLDGTAMKDRLTYHPDGIHVIYFDSEGHEVFSDFAHVKKSISGDAVDDYCFFNVFGYMYVDVLTWDKSGTVLYYANPYGVLERNGAFTFSETVQWADGTPCVGIAGGSGYANSDGTVEIR